MRPITAMKVIAQVAPEHHVALLEYLTDFPHGITVSSVGVHGPAKGLDVDKLKAAAKRVEAVNTQMANGKDAAGDLVEPVKAEEPEEPPVEMVPYREPKSQSGKIRVFVSKHLPDLRPFLRKKAIEAGYKPKDVDFAIGSMIKKGDVVMTLKGRTQHLEANPQR